MVFGMFSSQGTTPLVWLQTCVNSQIYKNIVQDHVVPIIQNSGFDRACKIIPMLQGKGGNELP